jgi:hypothetical protein
MIKVAASRGRNARARGLAPNVDLAASSVVITLDPSAAHR